MAINQKAIPLLTVHNLTLGFDGIKAVDGLSFDIQPRMISALIGPNGSGKTTVFNLISGLLKPDLGRVQLKGNDITHKQPDRIARMGLGRTFQDCKIFPQLPVLDNVMLGFEDAKHETLAAALMRSHSMFTAERDKKEHACQLLAQAGLLDKQGEWAGNLSYGQRKLLELCRVQAMNPEIYLLDEPMSGLFPAMVMKMMEMIRRLQESGKTVLFIEHNMKVVVELAERVLVVNFGRLIADDKPQVVVNKAEVIDAYLGRKANRVA